MKRNAIFFALFLFACSEPSGPSDECAALTCDSPPGPCYSAVGTCTDGVCSYELAENGSSCDDGDGCTENDICTDGECSGEDITCNTPNDNECIDDDTLRAFHANGTCEEGTCTYPHEDITCDRGCEAAGCIGDPCAGIFCETPDDDECLDESTLRTWAPEGTCEDGDCTYEYTDETCEFGCEAAECLPDPCAGIECDDPPNDCHAAVGTCSEGECSYEALDKTECHDGDECTVGDTCSKGECQPGPPLICDDENLCNGLETCDPVEGCQEGTPLVIDDEVDCTVDSCDPTSGEISHVPDDEFCTSDDPCEIPSCDIEFGCITTPNPDCCGGSLCETDVCILGECLDEACADLQTDVEAFDAAGMSVRWAFARCDDAYVRAGVATDVSADRIFYFIDHARISSGEPEDIELIAVDLTTGEEDWSLFVDDIYPDWTTVTDDGDVIHVSEGFRNLGYLVRRSGDDGSELWRRELTGNCSGGGACDVSLDHIALNSEQVVVGCTWKKLASVNIDTGVVNWTFRDDDLFTMAYISTLSIRSDGVVAASTNGNALHLFDTDGNLDHILRANNALHHALTVDDTYITVHRTWSDGDEDLIRTLDPADCSTEYCDPTTEISLGSRSSTASRVLTYGDDIILAVSQNGHTEYPKLRLVGEGGPIWESFELGHPGFHDILLLDDGTGVLTDSTRMIRFEIETGTFTDEVSELSRYGRFLSLSSVGDVILVTGAGVIAVELEHAVALPAGEWATTRGDLARSGRPTGL